MIYVILTLAAVIACVVYAGAKQKRHLKNLASQTTEFQSGAKRFGTKAAQDEAEARHLESALSDQARKDVEVFLMMKDRIRKLSFEIEDPELRMKYNAMAGEVQELINEVRYDSSLVMSIKPFFMVYVNRVITLSERYEKHEKNLNQGEEGQALKLNLIELLDSIQERFLSEKHRLLQGSKLDIEAQLSVLNKRLNLE